MDENDRANKAKMAVSRRVWQDYPRTNNKFRPTTQYDDRGVFRGHHVGQHVVRWGEDLRPVAVMEPQTTWERVSPSTRAATPVGRVRSIMHEDLSMHVWEDQAELDEFFYEVFPDWDPDASPRYVLLVDYLIEVGFTLREAWGTVYERAHDVTLHSQMRNELARGGSRRRRSLARQTDG